MLSLRLVVLVFLVDVALGYEHYDLAKAGQYFADFIQKYGKKYDSNEEFHSRFAVFKRTLSKINDWNREHGGGYAITQFTDQDGHRSCLGLSKLNKTAEAVKVDREFIVNAPDELDYRNQDLVTPVKDQGICIDCYVFAAIGNIEGMFAKKTGNLVSLSEQQALDCTAAGNCIGGYPLDVMNEMVSHGCMSDVDYSYVGEKQECHEDMNKVQVQVTGAQEISTPNIESMKGALVQYGAPLAIAFEATEQLMHFVGSGVISPSDCTGNSNHAVVLVGYGTDAASGKKYWLIKNSWGTSHGDQGYFKIDMQNNCDFGTSDTSTASVA